MCAELSYTFSIPGQKRVYLYKVKGRQNWRGVSSLFLSGFGAYPHLARRGSGEECVLNSPTLSPFLVKNVFICIK